MRSLCKRIQILLATAAVVCLVSGCGSSGNSDSNSNGIGVATLSWSPSSDPVAGYRVYYGTASRTYVNSIDTGNVTSVSVSNLGKGTFYFAVTAYNNQGIESDFSNEKTKSF